jgi:hypothetical protein
MGEKSCLEGRGHHLAAWKHVLNSSLAADPRSCFGLIPLATVRKLTTCVRTILLLSVCAIRLRVFYK